MASRARHPTTNSGGFRALALLLLALIALAAFVDGAAATKRPPPKNKKNKNKNSPAYTYPTDPPANTIATASAPLTCTGCTNGAKCVRGQCKCHPGSTGTNCEEMTKGRYFDSQTQKPKPCPGEFLASVFLFGRPRGAGQEERVRPPLAPRPPPPPPKTPTTTKTDDWAHAHQNPPSPSSTAPPHTKSTTTARAAPPTTCPRAARPGQSRRAPKRAT